MTGRWRWDGAAIALDTDWSQNNTVRMEPLSHCALHTARTPATFISARKDFSLACAKTRQYQSHRLPGAKRQRAAFANKGGQIFTQSSIELTEATQAHTQLPSPREAGSNSQVTFEQSDIRLRDNWPNWWLMFKVLRPCLDTWDVSGPSRCH